MIFVRAICLAMLLTSTIPASAQTPSPLEYMNIVEAASAASAVTVGCDDIGFSVLPEELENDIVDPAHHGACHHGVGAFMIGSCTQPFAHGDVSNPDGPAEGELHIFCNVAVFVAEDDVEVIVDPADFSIIDENSREIGVDLARQMRLPEAQRLNRVTI